MLSYIKNILSLKKITHRAVSFLAIWDNNTKFQRTSQLRRFSILKNCSIGKYTRINPGCKLANTSVGNFTAIGRGSSIGLGQHPTNYISTQNIFYLKNKMTNRWVNAINFKSKPIIIGSDVWIGVEAMVLDGVTIGDGAVIGARAVVTKDVAPFAIVVGMPARIVRYRFDQDLIDRLLEIKWWNLPEYEIDQKIDLFRKEGLTLEILNQYFPQITK